MDRFKSDRGILGKVPGELISRAMGALPKPDAGQPEAITAEVDVPDIGRVRVRCQLTSSRHHRGRNWFWHAVHAELLDGPDGEAEMGGG